MDSPVSKLGSPTLSVLSGVDLGTSLEKPPLSPPCINRDKNVALAVLQKSSTFTGESVYDHLVDVIKAIITERPKNVADHFEEFSRRIRRDRYRSDERSQYGFYQSNFQADASLKILAGLTLNTESSLLSNPFINQWMERLNYWSSAGIGFGHEKQLLLTISIQRLLTNETIQEVRFWGVIYGIEKNYYIAEATLTPTETEYRISVAEDTLLEMELRETQTSLKSSIIGDTPSNVELRTKIQDELKNQLQPSNLNGHVYFACNDFNMDWIELPSVTSKEIVQSRKIKKYCRGNLEENVKCHPPFSGTEKNYLRALIARISHGTSVAPIQVKEMAPFEHWFDAAYWAHAKSELKPDGSIEQVVAEEPNADADKRESNATDGDKRSSGQIESGAPRNSVRPSMANRNSKQAGANATGDIRQSTASQNTNVIDDDESVQSEISMPKTCEEDYFDERIRPWRIVPVDNHCIPDAIIVAESVIWNGAFSLASRNFVDHIYFGWGQKMTMESIVPRIHFTIQDEFSMTDVESKVAKYQ